MDKYIFLSGIYGFLQLSMRDVGLLLENGVWYKKRKHMTEAETNAIYLYEWVEDQLRSLPVHVIRKKSGEVDRMVKKLNNDNRYVNNFMLGVYMMREYIENACGKFEQDLILPKVNRIINTLDEEVMGGRFDPQIKKTTARVANNIYRQWAGLPQLSDQVRDAKFKRILKRT